jgi:hypothetical protein
VFLIENCSARAAVAALPMPEACNSEPYFVRLIHYIHLNSQKHGFVKAFRLYPYSSYQTLVSEKPTNLSRAETLDWFQVRENFMQMHDMLCDEALIRHLVEEDFD